MESKAYILIVEDEEKIRTGLKDFLEYHDFAVAEAADGLQAQQSVTDKTFDLILLDLMLPNVSGEQLCRQWRQQGLQTPIIMVTAKGQEKDKISGLHLGADDYVTKPFSLEELLARIEAVLRRTQPDRAVGTCFPFGPWQVDAECMKIRKDGDELDITKRQAEMIQFFAANPNRVVDRRELYRAIWREDMAGLETRTVDMHIAKLRSKIERDPAAPVIIKTVRRVGYLYEAEDTMSDRK